MQDSHHLMLADWRRQVTALYGRVRQEKDPHNAWDDFRRSRDMLFKQHPQSPFDKRQRDTFDMLHYFPYCPDLRLHGLVKPILEPRTYTVDLPAEGLLRFSQIATIHFNLTGSEAKLDLYWINGYGGGLYLPFRDATNGRDTYGGGRYLYDSIKGADLGATLEVISLDFNFAYNPSCAYNDQWACPLAPSENWLDVEIRAGEKAFLLQ